MNLIMVQFGYYNIKIEYLEQNPPIPLVNNISEFISVQNMSIHNAKDLMKS